MRRAGRGSAAIIGFDEVVMLGYRDSGMPDTEANADPSPSHRRRPRRGRRPAGGGHPPRPAAGASSPTATTSRATRTPTTCGCTTSRCWPSTRAGDPDWYPELGEPWQPLEAVLLGLVAGRGCWPCTRRSCELGRESPFDEKWFERPDQDDRITTRIDVGDYLDARPQSLLAHATQVDPTEAFWFGLRRRGAGRGVPVGGLVLARSLSADPPTARSRTTCSPASASGCVGGGR